MIEMRRAQLSFGDGLIATEVSDLREDWMTHADEVLADEQLVATVFEALARRRPKSRSRGRKGTPAEMVLRLLILKHVRNWSYDPKIRDEILEDGAALGGKGFSAHFGQCNGWLVSCQPALRAIFCPSARILEGFRHRYASGGSSFGFPRAGPAPEITTSPEWRLLPA